MATSDDSEHRRVFSTIQDFLRDEAPPTGLAADFYRQGPRRLGIVSFVLAGTLVFFFGLDVFQFEIIGWEAPPRNAEDRLRQLLLLGLSLAMGFCSRSRRLKPSTLVRLGIAFQITGAAVMAWAFFDADLSRLKDGHLTWLGVWILLFPLIAPAGARANIIAALVCASLAPAIYAAAWAFDSLSRSANPVELMNAFLPNYICAILGILPAALFSHLAERLKNMREKAEDIGTYTLIKLLGKGGMGEVWEAEHRLLRRRAAIKIIKAELLSPSSQHDREATILRFQREAAATAALRSPHTVSLFDYGQTDEGALYYIMERLVGLDLKELIERYGPIPFERAIYLGVQACDSLSEAHELGMVHRDIKPQNLFLCRLGPAYDFLKILDFGLVTLDVDLDPEDAATRLTQAGFILGTPSFLSPEQASNKKLDARSDLYSLGCVLYFLVTGELVFDHKLPMQVVLDHLHKTPTRPSKRLRRAVDPAFEELILACLAKKPEDRPASALELRDQLEACLGDNPWTRDRAREWWRVHQPTRKQESEASAPPPIVGIHDETAPVSNGPGLQSQRNLS